MELNSSNYFSPEAGRAYFSASQVKSFKRCEACAMAEIEGTYQRPMSQALLQGQFVDEALTGNYTDWVLGHPEISKRDGNLKAEFMKCQEMVSRAKRDRVFMSTMEGEHQVIRTGVIDGIPFKAKYDVYKQDDPDMKEVIVDLKTVKETLSDTKRATCLLSVISKEDPPDVNVVWIPQERLDAEMSILHSQLPRMEAVKSGVIPPTRCGKCAYCRATHMITSISSLEDFEDMGGNET